MRAFVAESVLPSALEAVQQACGRIEEKQPSLVVFFSDSSRFEQFSQLLAQQYPEATVLGASTFASFAPGGCHRDALRLAAFCDDIRVSAGVIREITRYPDMFYRDTVLDAYEEIREPGCTRDNTCCFVLNPAGTASEEKVLDTIHSALEGIDIPVVGGSSSSEVCLAGTVSLNGTVYASSSIFTMIHLERGRIYIHLENLYEPAAAQLEVTRSDPETRTLYEIGGRPAWEVLGSELQVPFEQLAGALAEHPIGRIIRGGMYINEVERINPDRSITTYCRILQPSRIVLLNRRDPMAVLSESMSSIHAAMPELTFSIVINCYSRTQMYLKNGWMQGFTEELSRNLGRYIGLTSHGEQLSDCQINLTMLVLSFSSAAS